MEQQQEFKPTIKRPRRKQWGISVEGWGQFYRSKLRGNRSEFIGSTSGDSCFLSSLIKAKVFFLFSQFPN
jgi:hypothetical protein